MPTVLIERSKPAYPGAPVIGTLGGDAPEMFTLEDPYIFVPWDRLSGPSPAWPVNPSMLAPDLIRWPYVAIKLPGVTAIPAGKYRAVMCYSQRFKCQLPYLKDVPSFTEIRIHPLNTQEDTQGCIGVGERREGPKSIGASQIALARLRKWWLETEPGGPIWVEVVNPKEE